MNVNMSVNSKMIILSACFVIFISGMALVVALFVGMAGDSDTTQVASEKIIGGEWGEYGCLGPAGYSWNKNVEACVREWELTDAQKMAARLAVEYVGYEEGITILQVQTARCLGCFYVEIEKGTGIVGVLIENYKVKTSTKIEL